MAFVMPTRKLCKYPREDYIFASPLATAFGISDPVDDWIESLKSNTIKEIIQILKGTLSPFI